MINNTVIYKSYTILNNKFLKYVTFYKRKCIQFRLDKFTILSSFTKSPSNFLVLSLVGLHYKRNQTDRFSVDTINSNRASLEVSL